MLLVEDNAGERWLVSEVLRSRGHQVFAVADAEAAWDSFTTDPVPLVVLDLVLPGEDGLALCRRIREHPGGADVVIVAVTGKRDPQVLQEILDAGADDCLFKPVDVPALNIRLAIAERQVRRHRELRSAHEEEVARDGETRALIANLDEVIFSIDPRSQTLQRVSDGARRVLGRSPEALRADPRLWRSLLYPPEVEVRQEELAGEDAHPVVHRWQISLPDGSPRWVEVSAKGALDAENRLTRVDCLLADVTESQRSQEELAARNKELMTLYRISEITLSASSLESACEEILEELCKATGFPVAAVEQYDPVGERLAIAAARGMGDDAGDLEFGIHETLSGRVVRTGQPVIETNALAQSDLAPPFRSLGVRTYLSFPMTAGHQIVGALTLAHTSAVQPDRRLIRWVGSLATGVAQLLDRVAAETALRESELRHRVLAEQLQQANQELESFAYSVSHDLRAPLRTMQGFAHALLQNFADRLPREARDYAERIIASGKQSEVLIRDLLAYSRLSFEELKMEPVALAQVVSAAREQVEGDIDAGGAEITVEGDLPTVLGQSTTLVQVVANLLSNAVKFSSVDRPPRVWVHAEEVDSYVRLWVEDNGIGVAPEQEERIFRVFERLTEGGARPGTGIGLAVVRRGMEKMGGRAGLGPPPAAGGSAFWIDIPRVEGPHRRPWGRRRSR